MKWRGGAAAGQDGGIRGLRFSGTQPCCRTDIGSWKQMLFFWEFCFIGVFVLFSQAASTEHIRLDGGGRFYLEVSEESMSSFDL